MPNTIHNTHKNNNVLIIAGPTASGKTALAIEISKTFHGEIINCDSMQIYKYMNIGSAKPTSQELNEAPHHLFDFVDPGDDFSVAEYQPMALDKIDALLHLNRLPIISGGTGLYLNSILYDMEFADTAKDTELRNFLIKRLESEGSEIMYKELVQLAPSLASTIHPNNRQRLIRAMERVLSENKDTTPFKELSKKYRENYNFILIGLKREREELYERINTRVELLIKAGLVDEVKGLMKHGYTRDHISMKGIGYKEVIDYLEGVHSLEDTVEIIKRNTRRFAKRQMTWFKRYDDMKWFNMSCDKTENIMDYIRERLNHGTEETD